MSFFSSKKESGVVLVLDIGSGSVGGGLVLASKGHAPTLLYSFRSEIPFQQEATGARLLSLMLRSLSQVVLAIAHEGFDRAGFPNHRPVVVQAIVSLSAPWVVSKTSFLELKNEKPLTVTERVFTELLKHSENDTRPSEHVLPKESVLIEQKLIKSVLNGYSVLEPYQKEASTAEFAVFRSFSVPTVTEKISNTISATIHSEHITFHSFSLLAFEVLRELHPSEDSFMLGDVSGEQTELSIVKDSVLAETISFPFGKNKLIRALKRSASIPEGGAQALFRLYAEKKGTGKLFEKAQRSLQIALAEWQKEFLTSLTTFSEEMLHPKLLFLTVDEDVASLFAAVIGSGDWSGQSLTPTPPQVVVVDGDLFAGKMTYASSEGRDPFLGIITASVGKRLRQ